MTLPYLDTFTDRHGMTRCYVRHAGKRVAITAPPGTAEFAAEYEAAKLAVGLPTWAQRLGIMHRPVDNDWEQRPIARDARNKWRPFHPRELPNSRARFGRAGKTGNEINEEKMTCEPLSD